MGFETIVRPVVFPNIRPQAPRVLPPEDDPEQGIATIRGNPAQTVTFSHSYSFNWSSSRQVETERQFDEVRIYQVDDNGTVNRDNFVDIEVANEITKEGAKGASSGDDSEIDEIRNADKDFQRRKRWREFYKRVEEAPNVEIRNRDVVKKNEDAENQIKEQ